MGSTVLGSPEHRFQNGGTTPTAGNMLVSVSLLSPGASGKAKMDPAGRRGVIDRIFPMDVFSLEIFLLNTSPVVRRCEIGFPERKRRRNDSLTSETGKLARGASGVMPLDNRIRVGPLLPGTCQSIRMHLLALTPGVHMIDTLTLTDTGTDFTMNLRSVMNVVVEDPSLSSPL